jgi:hypothetical protein
VEAFRVAADGDAGLCLRRNFSGTRSGAIWAGTIPLWQTAAGCAAENVNANQPGIFGVRQSTFDQTAPA